VEKVEKKQKEIREQLWAEKRAYEAKQKEEREKKKQKDTMDKKVAM